MCQLLMVWSGGGVNGRSCILERVVSIGNDDDLTADDDLTFVAKVFRIK